MDRHLNIFHSYNQGDFQTLSKIKQLENNITRAFISTIINLPIQHQNTIIQKLINANNQSEEYKYYLQSIDNELALENYSKYLIVLQRDRSSIRMNDFGNFDFDLLTLIDEITQEERDEIITGLSNCLRNQTNYRNDDLGLFIHTG